jgi:hypothetical protein
MGIRPGAASWRGLEKQDRLHRITGPIAGSMVDSVGYLIFKGASRSQHVRH